MSERNQQKLYCPSYQQEHNDRTEDNVPQEDEDNSVPNLPVVPGNCAHITGFGFVQNNKSVGQRLVAVRVYPGL